MHDDAFGVGEALNENAFGKGLIARGTNFLVFGAKEQSPSIEATERFVQLQKHLPAVLFFSDSSKFNYDNWRTSFTNIVSKE